MSEYTWEQVVEAKVGCIFVDRFDEGLRFLIMRGPFHLCAYIGIPMDHPLAKRNYDDLPIDCHGGLTFAGEGRKRGEWPAGFYWYGWDYGHCDDYMISDHHSVDYARFNESRTKWGVKEVDDNSWHALYQFKRLMRLVESVANEAKLSTLAAISK